MPGNVSSTLSSIMPPRGGQSLGSLSLQAVMKQQMAPPGAPVPPASSAQLPAMDRIRPGMTTSMFTWSKLNCKRPQYCFFIKSDCLLENSFFYVYVIK